MQDLTGANAADRYSITAVQNTPNSVQLQAQDSPFQGERYFRIMPDALAGLSYADATQEQKDFYGFVGDNSDPPLLSDGTEAHWLI